MEEEKIAVALKYEPEKGAPEVIAKGIGYLAHLILQIAKEYKIPIKEDSTLVRELYKLELNKPIPPELYQAVAVVIAWAFKLNEQLKKKVLNSFKERKP
ncbi:MAG: EscU/YscU/HrcU family type III secretion system export apparatus switch protein [Caldimicrobium sp.]